MRRPAASRADSDALPRQLRRKLCVSADPRRLTIAVTRSNNLTSHLNRPRQTACRVAACRTGRWRQCDKCGRVLDGQVGLAKHKVRCRVMALSLTRRRAASPSKLRRKRPIGRASAASTRRPRSTLSSGCSRTATMSLRPSPRRRQAGRRTARGRPVHRTRAQLAATPRLSATRP